MKPSNNRNGSTVTTTDQTFDAPRCDKCNQPKQPRLIEITAMGNTSHRWLLAWNCETWINCTKTETAAP